MSKKNAFTLVELLVVIAIIALLMSILMPALSRVRTQAKTVICQSNLKQWGICFAMYVDDWDGSFMAGFVEPPDPPNAYRDYWMEALRRCYGDVGDIRLCPMATKPGTEVGWTPYGGVPPDSTFYAWGIFTGAWNYAVEGDYGSYGWNGLLANPPEGKGIWGRFKEQGLDPNWRNAAARGAALIPVLLDHQWVDCWPDHIDEPPEFSGQPWGGCSQMGRFTVKRHDEHLNYVFLDWSVRKIGLKQSWRLKWHKLSDLTYPLPPEFEDSSHWMYKFKDPE